ncbi:MAG: outer membrane beta-barrel protein [Flavobacterium sp.]|nr:outer membrane beta-barrel protein [Flavobacterium sp.]
MRRVFILFIILFSINNKLCAQVTFNPGIQSGLNVSKITEMDLPSRKDYYFGVYGAIKFSKKYTLQPEITYSRQGAKGIYTAYHPAIGQYLTNSADISLQYLSISINNKITIYKNLYFNLGEFTDFVVGDDIVQDNGSTSISKGQDIDYGVFGGLGYQISKNFGVEGRVKKGFGDALDFSVNQKNATMTNVVFQIGATYTINFKK